MSRADVLNMSCFHITWAQQADKCVRLFRPLSGTRGQCGSHVTSPLRVCVQVYPYEVLVVTHRGRSKLPLGVDRTQLEVKK